MSKRTRPHKRSKFKKAAKRKTHGGFFSRYSSRAKIVAAMIVSVLLAAVSLAYWKVADEKVAPAPSRSEAMNKPVVKNVSTLSANELADIPPEAFTRRPPADFGYNAHSGGLPPGALPPGVVLPGMSMTQGGQGYGGYDGVRQQFTSKERDRETGLDYFGARYYSSTQGRFTSPDPGNAGADVGNPQSWNGYSYSLNNPLRYIDPDGLRWAQALVNGGTQYQWFDDDEKDANGQTAYGRALGSGWSAVTFNKSGTLSFTDGLLAPGETLRTVTLSEDSPTYSVSSHTVTLGEWTKWLYIHSLSDIAFGTQSEANQLNDFVSSIVGAHTNASGNGPDVPGPALGAPTEGSVSLSKSEQRKLGNLASRAKDKVADVIRSRGGTGANVRQAGQWAEKTLAETAKAAAKGDSSAASAIKLAKQAGRLGQKY